MAKEHAQPRPPEDRQTIVCIYCGKPQEVSRRAINVTCRFCSKSLTLEDTVVRDYRARRHLDTVGLVVVEKKGHVVSDRILCGGIVVRGRVKAATITSRGAVLVGPEAEVRGDVVAPTLAVGAGAVLSGHYRIGPSDGAPAADGEAGAA